MDELENATVKYLNKTIVNKNTREEFDVFLVQEGEFGNIYINIKPKGNINAPGDRIFFNEANNDYEIRE